MSDFMAPPERILMLGMASFSPPLFYAVSRAQRSTKRSEVMRCRPGIVTNSESAAIPDQRCTATLRCALHRIREKKEERAANVAAL
jgi:hypothetical protein